MRYAYAITSALLVGGAAATMALQTPVGAQTAQNDGMTTASAPRAGAPGSFADLVARLQPAVVNISTEQRVTVQQNNPFAGTPFEGFFGNRGGSGQPVQRRGNSLGSGFLISNDGYIVTNNHVVSAGTRNAVVESIKVTMTDGREMTARLVGRDVESDLAVLKVEGNGLPFVRLGSSGNARAGDWVVAIGNPFGLGGTVTAGIISSVQRVTGQGGPFDRFIQTDASINMGNSGGPLFDLNGNVIGINSQIYSPTGGNVGIGFAIPADEARSIIETLRSGETVQRGYLGVGIQPLTPDLAQGLNLPSNLPRDRGEVISSVQPGQPAAAAGIRQGDVVVRVNNQDVTPDQSLSYLVANVRPGTTIPVELIRDGRRQTVRVRVGTRPSAEELAATEFDPNAEQPMPGRPSDDAASATAALGLSVQALTPQIARSIGVAQDTRGVVILAVDPSSDAAQKGLTRGLVITSANRTPVATPADLARVVTQARAANRDSVLLYVQTRAVSRFVSVELAAR
ncbi:Do family serine endopeptidase [Sphingomonas aestuarii]